MPFRDDRLYLATAVADSNNVKVGKAAATYAAQASCPTSCVFFNGGGCYAENGQIYMGVTKRLNDDAEMVRATDLDIAHAEADAIDELDVYPGHPMRLHTVGDCRTDAAATVVAAAATRYRERGGGPVWTYTHAWRTVERESWAEVSVLASCETPAQIAQARARGYAPSITVEEFPGRRLYELDGEKVLPCPAQTSHATCASCRLCFDSEALLERGYAIGFEVHGTAFSVRQARAALRDPDDPNRRLTLRELIPAYLVEHPGTSDEKMAKALGYAYASVRQMRMKMALEAGIGCRVCGSEHELHRVGGVMVCAAHVDRWQEASHAPGDYERMLT